MYHALVVLSKPLVITLLLSRAVAMGPHQFQHYQVTAYLPQPRRPGVPGEHI